MSVLRLFISFYLASGEVIDCDNVTDSSPVGALQEQFNAEMKICETANSPVNDEASSSLEARALAKWSCAACTYQNWPKSSKCIMCGRILIVLKLLRNIHLDFFMI